jgi:hypothetical protein
MKGTIKIVAETARNAIDIKTDKSKGGLTVGTNSATVTAFNTTVGLAGGKVGEALPKAKIKISAPTAKQAVKTARKDGTVVTKKVRETIQTNAKAKQATAKEVGETLNSSGGNAVAGTGAEYTKRKVEQNIAPKYK